jgi:hypothetical protein
MHASIDDIAILRIELEGIEPLIWRRLAVRTSINLKAKQLNRRALDSLYNADIVAVGMFKISISLENSGPRWIPEIYEIVAGPTRDELYAA